MPANLDTTHVLAFLIGLYFCAASLGIMNNRTAVWDMVAELSGSPALGYIGGLIAFAMGGAMVAIHNDWGTPLAIAVSAIGWICLIEGVLLLAVREQFIGLFTRWRPTPAVMMAIALVTMAAGVVLVAAGLSG